MACLVYCKKYEAINPAKDHRGNFLLLKTSLIVEMINVRS